MFRQETPVSRALCRLAPFAMMAVLSAGCTHSLAIKNIDQYAKTASSSKKLVLVLEDRADTPDGHKLAGFVHDALSSHPDVAQVVQSSGSETTVPPDAVVAIRPKAEFEGSWWNYPITFPGFLLFTHAWNGYVYEADLTTELDIAPDGHRGTQRDVLHTAYDLRHCDFERGAAASSGWYLPGWGGTNLIVGFFMVPYDDDATAEFLEKVRVPYGQFVANSIVGAVARSAPLKTASRVEAGHCLACCGALARNGREASAASHG